MKLDVETVAAAIREATAIEILPRFNRLAQKDVMEKAQGDLVTTADIMAEARLTRAVLALLPGSAAIGEEGAAKKPQILDLLEDSEPLWLIDPVDGTHNFAHGDPRFAVMMALVMGRETVAGWIYEPLRDSMAIAEKGGGAWLDGKKMTVADTRSKKRLNGYAGWSGRKKIQKYLGSEFSTLTSLRCVGIEYRNIANGDADFAVYSRLKPWDHAPGELLFREAGGMSAMQIGKAPYRPHLYGNNGMVLATDRRLISKLKSAMAGHA